MDEYIRLSPSTSLPSPDMKHVRTVAVPPEACALRAGTGPLGETAPVPDKAESETVPFAEPEHLEISRTLSALQHNSGSRRAACRMPRTFNRNEPGQPGRHREAKTWNTATVSGFSRHTDTRPSSGNPRQFRPNKKQDNNLIYSLLSCCTRSRGRTGTTLLSLVFETNASTDSAIRADAAEQRIGTAKIGEFRYISKKSATFRSTP